MTKKEKETQIALGTYLPNKWKEYLDRQDKIDALHAEIDQLELLASFWWADAITDVYGENAIIKWQSKRKCTVVDGGDVKGKFE